MGCQLDNVALRSYASSTAAGTIMADQSAARINSALRCHLRPAAGKQADRPAGQAKISRSSFRLPATYTLTF